MSKKQLFSFQAKPFECIRLARMLRQASKLCEGAQDRLNLYWAKLCQRYGYVAPERYEITIVAGWVFVHQWPEQTQPYASAPLERREGVQP